MKIKELMTPHAKCLGPEESLAAAAGIMRDLDVGSLPVCDHERLVGMITDRDLVVRGLAESRDARATPVRELMTPGVVYVFEDQDAEDAARLMEVKQVRRLPVLDRDQRLVGLLSLGDVALRSRQLSSEALQEIAQPPHPPEVASDAGASSVLAPLRAARDLRGSTLAARDGEIGHVRDLYFDDRHWNVRYFVVDAGAWLSRRHVLISPEAVPADWKPEPGTEPLAVPVALTRDQVRHSPDVANASTVSRQHEEELRRYYGWPFYWGAVGAESAWAAGAAPPRPHPPADPTGDPHLRSMQEVAGYRVEASDGGIGHVADFLVDLHSWGVRYLIVETRNWWPGRRVLVAPWWIYAIDWAAERVTCDLTRQAIRTSPAYSGEPLTVDYAGQLHDHYGRPRYPQWEGRRASLE
jgi:CBS domain-containing protein